MNKLVNKQTFTLKPFAIHPGLETLQVNGYAVRAAHELRLHYELSQELSQKLGDFPAIALANPSQSPQRLDNLWETTCFECFLALIDSSSYWEINLSPAGHWNIYRFEDYRQGMQSETAWSALPFTMSIGGQGLKLDLVLDLGALWGTEPSFQLGITAVIADPAQNLSYWALSHPGQVPDFHRRESFLLNFF